MRDPEAPISIKEELDRCVKCGMCLAECPTYRLEADENESPRGRLALMEGLVQGHLDGDPPLIAHLDHCLGCRRCERICPSRVRYGHLIDHTRELLSDKKGSRWAGLMQKQSLLRLGTKLAQTVPTAFSAPLGGMHRLHGMARALGNKGAAPSPGEYPATSSKTRGRVGLFLGCASAAQQGGALQAALQLLRHAGYGVSVPGTSPCCGALSQHAGDPRTAARLAGENRDAFDDELDRVLSIASGCGTHIDSYQPALASGHQDICRFLLESESLSAADFSPLPKRIFLHTPCSVENIYRGGDWARGLLALIPDLEIATVGEAGQCCGAAGDYMLRYPDIAARLREPVLHEVRSDTGLVLLTSNVGCAIHLADGLRKRGSDIEVLHPVELLARQLIVGPGA